MAIGMRVMGPFRTGYVVFRGQWKMKKKKNYKKKLHAPLPSQISLIKHKVKENLIKNFRMLAEWCLSEHGVLCDSSDYTPMKPALGPGISVLPPVDTTCLYCLKVNR